MSVMMALIPLLAGIGLSVQSAVNGILGQKVGTVESAFLSFFTGSIFLTIVVILFGRGDIFMITKVPAWQLLCAICGIIFISVMVFVVPKIGVTAASVTVIIGQLTASMAIDHFGWFVSEVNQFSFKRLIGIVLLFGSLYFVYKGKNEELEVNQVPKRQTEPPY